MSSEQRSEQQAAVRGAYLPGEPVVQRAQIVDDDDDLGDEVAHQFLDLRAVVVSERQIFIGVGRGGGSSLGDRAVDRTLLGPREGIFAPSGAGVVEQLGEFRVGEALRSLEPGMSEVVV